MISLDLYWTGSPSQDRMQWPVHPGVREHQGPHWCNQGEVCEGCERHFLRHREVCEARNHLNLVIEFLKQQAEGKLGLARAVLTHHCNHPNVIPYYPEWWRGETLPDNYFCSVCRDTLQPQELLATYEQTKRELEVAPGGGGQPGREPDEDPQQDLQEEVELSPEPNQGAARGRRDKVTPARVMFREREGEEEVNWRRELNLPDHSP